MTDRLFWRILRWMFMATLVGVICCLWVKCNYLEKQNAVLASRVQTLDEAVRGADGIVLRVRTVARANGLPPWGLGAEEGRTR